MKRKIGNCSARLSWMVILTIVGLLLTLSCEQTTGPEKGTADVDRKLIIYTDQSSIVANKGSANIFVKVYSGDDTTKAVSGVRVTFSADTLVTIQTVNDLTDANGISRAIIFAGKSEGTVRITAAIDNYSNAAFVQITPDQGLIERDLQLRLSSEPSVLAANGADISEIKAQLFDTDNNPVKGETIYFTTSLGIILESAVTDDWGIATVNLRSDRTNGIADVKARYNQIIKSTMVEFSGAEVKSKAIPIILVADNTSKSTLTISLNDASGSPIVEGRVNISTSLGTLYSADGVSSGTAIVDSSSTQGKVTAYLSSGDDGEAIVRISALGSTDSLSVYFTNYTFSLTASEPEIFAGGSKTLIIAALKDSDGSIVPIELDDVEFSTNLGKISKREKMENGTVSAELESGPSIGTATVTAEIKKPPVSSSTSVIFVASKVDSLLITADKLSVKMGREETVDIRATVFDVTGNPKSGVSVTFSLLKGPGGGEEIVPGTAITDDRGDAVVTFKPGSKGSKLEGIEIQARVGDIMSNILKLTIAGEPHSVAVGFNTDSFTSNANGTYGVSVSAIVSDVNRNKVADGTFVSFSLKGDVGVITDQVATVDGVATTTLIYSPSDAGKEVVVTASSGGNNDTKTVVLPGAKEGTVSTLDISPKDSSIIADGVSTIDLNIFLADVDGQPLSNITVYCETDIGEIQSTAITGDPSNPNSAPGKASVIFTSMASWVDRVAHVKVSSGGVEEEVIINLKGISIEITADPDEIPSDGQTKSIINVLVKESTSHIPISGKEVSFGASDGYIEGSKFTDSSGVARTVFTAGYNPGTAYIMVSFGSTLVDTLEVTVKEVEARGIQLFANPSQIPANGISTSTISALLRDDNNNPIIGEIVFFTTNLGTITAADSTDENGRAEATLVSERKNGEATITARYKKHVETIPVSFAGAVVKSQAVPTILVADNTSRATLTVSLSDASGSPIVEGIVNISTTLGTLYSADGVSSGTAIVDSTSTLGEVTAYLSSGEDGEAEVKFSALGSVNSLTVYFTNYTFSLTASESEIFAGGMKTQIIAALKDNDGTIVPIELDDVEFSTNLGKITKSEKMENGTVSAELESGPSIGVATVTAEIKKPPVISSTKVSFVAATVDSLVITADKLSARVGSEESVDIRATVFDVTGNPKSDVSVTFSLLKGPGGGEEIVPGTALTDERGEAIVSFKPGNKGSLLEGVEIQARVGDIMSNILKLTIAGEPHSVVVGFNTDSFTSNSNGTYGIDVSAIVSDVNRNKVADGTIVSFSLKGDVGVISDQVNTTDGVAATTLIYSPSDAGKEVVVTASSGGIQDTKTVILPGQEGTVSTLEVSPKESSVIADGVSAITLSIFLADTDGQPLSNKTVYCESDIGTIEPSAITGDPGDPNAAPGKASVKFTGPALWEDGVAHVTVNSGGVEENITINLRGVTLEITADPVELPSDGQTKSIISVLIKETTSHIPLISKEVSFGASDGYIEGMKFTDASGVAKSVFTAGFNPGTVFIMVSFGATLVDSVEVSIREVEARGIELFASPSQIPANGISTSLITALLRDDNFNPVIGENIVFTTDLGTITAADSTDENGRAEATLVSERKNGEATVTASYKKHLETIPVSFTGVKLNVSATPENLFAGGEEETIVTAYVKDAAEVPIVGTDVTFKWYLDDVEIGEKVAKTDVQGRASIPISSDESGRARILISGAGAADSTFVIFTRLQFIVDGESESVSTGGKELQVWAQLYDTVEEKFVENAEVEFFTTLGLISESAITDSDGKAAATLTSGNTAGSVTVSASTKYGEFRVSAEKNFTFVNAAPDSINLKLDANIVSIGGASSELIAIVTDEFGNPVPESLVSFKVLQGPAGGEYIHPAIVTTGTSGIASTFFYSGQVPSEFESVYIQAQVGSVESNVAKLTIAGAPETIRPGYQTEWDLQNIDNGDGTFSLPISALVLDANSNGVVDGTTVYFKVFPPEGAAMSPVKTVNSVAASTITYPSASAGKEITLTASAGGKEGSILFTLPGFQVSWIAVTASPKSIPADGEATTTIRATIFDKNGSSLNVPDGTTVSFITEGGTLEPVVSKTEKGVATAILTSDKNAVKYVMVTAQSGILEGFTWVYFEEVGTSINQVAKIKLEVDNDERTIMANGIDVSNITATILTFEDSLVTTPTNVVFETDIGEITRFQQTNEEGKAVAQFSSGVVGTANITATVGNVTSTTTIVIVPGNPRSVELTFEPTSVGVEGSGRNETLQMTANVKDNKNNPVGNGNLVKFELVGAFDIEASISPPGGDNYESEPVPTVNGAATVSFHSGRRAGTVRVKATVVDANGTPLDPMITSETTQFLVHSGPAYLDMRNADDPFTDSRITVGSGPQNIYAGGIGGDDNKATIAVIISDRFKNPVPEGTSVYFTTTGGTITTSTGYTDKNGLASVTLYASNPFPTRQNSNIIGNPNSSIAGPLFFDMPLYDFDGNGVENDGIAIVTAHTEGIDHEGNEVTVWNYTPVVFSLNVSTFTVVPAATILLRGQSTVITITIHDINGNPVMGGSEMTLSTTIGDLSTKILTTGSPGDTTYKITLTNNLDPLSDSSGDTVVSVKLTTPNGGDKTVASIPVYMSTSSP